jgi:hypothetical protein
VGVVSVRVDRKLRGSKASRSQLPALEVDELKRRLEIFGEIANNIVLRVDRGAYSAVKELWRIDPDAGHELEYALHDMDRDLEYQYYEVLRELLSKALGKYHIDSSKMTLDEINRLYEESGFREWLDDECIHLGFARVVHGGKVKNALIFTCSNLFRDKKLKLEVAIEGNVID